jgi:hypothetical protein
VSNDVKGAGLWYRKVPGFIVFHEHRQQVDQLLLRSSNLGLPGQFLQLLNIELVLAVPVDNLRLGLRKERSVISCDAMHFLPLFWIK